MSGWIKIEKDLKDDPRVLRIASRLRHADVTLGSRSVPLVIGALVTLWWYADTHITDDDVLAIGADEIDQLVGLPGFCSLMPSDWLQIIDSEHVKLIDYTTHNGTLAKNRALQNKRQERHRENTPASRSRHAPVTQDALPDKTRQDIDETRQKDSAARESDEVRITPEGKMAIALRDLGVTVGSQDPTLVAWVRDGFTVKQATDAVGIARIRKPHPEPISPRYIDPILREPPRPPPAQRPRATTPWERVMEANGGE